MDQMQQEAQQAKTQPVDFRLSRMDPFGLRYIALLFVTWGFVRIPSRVADLAISPALPCKCQTPLRGRVG